MIPIPRRAASETPRTANAAVPAMPITLVSASPISLTVSAVIKDGTLTAAEAGSAATEAVVARPGLC